MVFVITSRKTVGIYHEGALRNKKKKLKDNFLWKYSNRSKGKKMNVRVSVMDQYVKRLGVQA